MEQYFPVLAVVLDAIIGDPRSKLHPVVMIGYLISAFEKVLLQAKNSPLRKKIAGFVLVVLVLASVYGTVWVIEQLLQNLHPVISATGSIILLSFTISPRSLAEAGREIRRYLLAGDLKQARFKVGWIVGRDTENLTVPEITRATVETIAENIVDGIISPLFYYILGGLPLAFLYRAVNTMDSMVGYKNEKYIDFGMPAAKIDDIFNYIPARITALLIVIAALVLGYKAGNARRCIFRDAAKHPSPNSGYAEAGVAGALNIRLGGLNYYGGVASFREYMGEAGNQLAPEHIQKTISIMYFVTILFSILSIFIR